MKFLLMFIVLGLFCACGSHMSTGEGYNIAGVGLVPSERCYDTTWVFERSSMHPRVKEVMCEDVKHYEFSW